MLTRCIMLATAMCVVAGSRVATDVVSLSCGVCDPTLTSPVLSRTSTCLCLTFFTRPSKEEGLRPPSKALLCVFNCGWSYLLLYHQVNCTFLNVFVIGLSIYLCGGDGLVSQELADQLNVAGGVREPLGR